MTVVEEALAGRKKERGHLMKPRKKGRPERFMKFEGSPEELAQAIFSKAKKPDPSRRQHNEKATREAAPNG